MWKTYQSDLSDSEWARIEPFLPIPKAAGRPRIHSPREILNAIFYIVRSGCAWRLLLHDLPPWKTVHHYFRIWRLDGVWERLNAALRERLRVRQGRNPHPSAGMVDSQSAKTTGVGGEARPRRTETAARSASERVWCRARGSISGISEKRALRLSDSTLRVGNKASPAGLVQLASSVSGAAQGASGPRRQSRRRSTSARSVPATARTTQAANPALKPSVRAARRPDPTAHDTATVETTATPRA